MRFIKILLKYENSVKMYIDGIPLFGDAFIFKKFMQNAPYFNISGMGLEIKSLFTECFVREN